jgi:hypothetical protein
MTEADGAGAARQVEEAHQASIGPGEYSALGDIRTVLERYLATTLRQFGAEQPQAREVLKALVTGDNTARAVFPEELLSRLHTAGVLLTVQELEQRYLRRLVQARLVRATEVDGQTRYELTHEFLVTQITTWIEASERDRTKMLEMLTRAYEVYQVTGQLLSPQALEMLAPWQDQLVLPEAQQAFLAQSERALRRRRATLWRSVAGAAAVLMLLLGGGSLWYWDAYQREHVEHYANVITRWGLPEGVGRLTADQVRQRNTSLAFHKHGRRGPVHEIRLVNSRDVYPPVFAQTSWFTLASLNPLSQETVDGVPETLATSSLVFERDARGKILNQIAYNRAGRQIYMLRYVHPNAAEYKHGDITQVPRESGIALLRFIRPEIGPEVGLAQEVRYFDRAGTPQPDRDGAYGVRYIFDPRGLPVKAIVLGADGQPAVTRAGLATSTSTYDAMGNLTQNVLFDRNDQVFLNKDGVAGSKFAYDPSGNLQELAFIGTDDQLVTMRRMRAAGRGFRYDSGGNLIESTFFDRHRQPVTGSLGRRTPVPAFAKQTVEWDEYGRSTETYFDPDDKPMVIGDRVVKNRGVWDTRGYLVEVSHFDEHGRPIRDKEGCATLRLTRDAHGSLVELTCLDEREQPIRSTNGWAYAKWVRDDRGNAIEESYFGPTGQLDHYEEPYVKTRYKYNPQGKQVEKAYFDSTDQLVNNLEGFAKVTYTYDLQGNLTGAAFFDAQHQPTLRKGKYAKLLNAYDARNQLIEQTTCDTEGQPTLGEDGYATARHAYDPQGNRIETAYFDEHNRPTLHTDGNAKILKQYSDTGQLVESAYVGLDSASVLHKKGHAKVRRTYNARGKVAQVAYFDPEDRLVRLIHGYAIVRFTYDDLGRETMRTFFDLHGVPVHTRVVVKKMKPNRTAQERGLQVGDILVSYDGEEIRDVHMFIELELVKGERHRELRILRQDREVLLKLEPGRLTGLELADSTESSS